MERDGGNFQDAFVQAGVLRETPEVPGAFLRSPLLWSWVLYYLLFLLSWHLFPGRLYGGDDGQLSAWLATSMAKWAGPFDLWALNFFQGMGSPYIPLNPWLNPGSLALNLPLGPLQAMMVSYSVFWFEVAASSYIMFRVFGFSLIESTVAAQLLLLLCFPYFDVVMQMPGWHVVAPYYAHGMALGSAMMTLLFLLGPRSVLVNILLVGGVITLALYEFSVMPMIFLAWAPAYMVLFAGISISGFRVHWLAWRLATVAVLVGMLWILGVFHFYGTAIEATVRAWIPLDRAIPLSFGSALESFYGKILTRPEIPLMSPHFKIRFLVHAMSLGGAILALFVRDHRYVALGLACIGWWVLIHSTAFLAHCGLLDSLRIKEAHSCHILWAGFPWLAIFLIFFLSEVWHLATRLMFVGLAPGTEFILRGRSGTGITSLIRRVGQPFVWSLSAAGKRIAIAALIIPAIALGLLVSEVGGIDRILTYTRSVDRPFDPWVGNEPWRWWPARKTSPIVSYLEREASLAPGGRFRGYVLSHFGSVESPMRPEIKSSHVFRRPHLAAGDYVLIHYGNKHRLLDLWMLDIPTIEQYGQTITPLSVLMFGELLSRPEGEVYTNNYLLVDTLHIDVLRALGVRYVITDVPLTQSGIALKLKQEAPRAVPIYLYEVADPNLGNYSPAHVIVAATAKEAIERMKRPGFSMESDIILQGPLNSGLEIIPASHAFLYFEKNALRIVAVSKGRSILLLPVQYSNCLDVKEVLSNSSGESVRFFRANLIQTGLLFEGRIDVKVPFAFGMPGKSVCTRMDVHDLKSLDISSVLSEHSELRHYAADPPAWKEVQ